MGSADTLIYTITCVFTRQSILHCAVMAKRSPVRLSSVTTMRSDEHGFCSICAVLSPNTATTCVFMYTRTTSPQTQTGHSGGESEDKQSLQKQGTGGGKAPLISEPPPQTVAERRNSAGYRGRERSRKSSSVLCVVVVVVVVVFVCCCCVLPQ